VVIDDIEDDLDPGAVQCLDHVAKFVERAQRLRPGAVPAMRREKRQGPISPIIAEARRTVLLVECKHREKLDSADAEVAQIGDFLDEAGVGAAPAPSDTRARVAGEPVDMHLVNDRLSERPTERLIALPIIRADLRDDAL
jgi:hypothetical protein